MHHAKNLGNKEIPLAILSRILALSCVTPPYIIKAKGFTHDCASILDSIARGISLFPRFFTWCIPSLHPHSFNFCTCIYIYAHTHTQDKYPNPPVHSCRGLINIWSLCTVYTDAMPLTLHMHVQEGYGTCLFVYLSVCLSVCLLAL